MPDSTPSAAAGQDQPQPMPDRSVTRQNRRAGHRPCLAAAIPSRLTVGGQPTEAPVVEACQPEPMAAGGVTHDYTPGLPPAGLSRRARNPTEAGKSRSTPVAAAGLFDTGAAYPLSRFLPLLGLGDPISSGLGRGALVLRPRPVDRRRARVSTTSTMALAHGFGHGFAHGFGRGFGWLAAAPASARFCGGRRHGRRRSPLAELSQVQIWSPAELRAISLSGCKREEPRRWVCKRSGSRCAGRRICAFCEGRGRYVDDVKAAARGARLCRALAACACPHRRARCRGGAGRARCARGTDRRRTAAARPRHADARWCRADAATAPPAFVCPQPLLAQERVRYVGDPVAFIVAETLEPGEGRGRADRDRVRAAAGGHRRPRRRSRRTRPRCGTTTRATRRSFTRPATRRRSTPPSPGPTHSSATRS